MKLWYMAIKYWLQRIFKKLVRRESSKRGAIAGAAGANPEDAEIAAFLDAWLLEEPEESHLFSLSRFNGDPKHIVCDLSVHQKFGNRSLVTRSEGRASTWTGAFSHALAALDSERTRPVENQPTKKGSVESTTK